MSLDVDGYLSFEAHPEELIYALRLIETGTKYYDPDIIDLLIAMHNEPRIDNSSLELLTTKENEVLQNIGMGFSNKQIAENLFISENTVKKHVSQVLSKLELSDRTQAALFANITGLATYKHAVV